MLVADVDVVDETSNRHIRGLEALPLNRGDKMKRVGSMAVPLDGH